MVINLIYIILEYNSFKKHKELKKDRKKCIIKIKN